MSRKFLMHLFRFIGIILIIIIFFFINFLVTIGMWIPVVIMYGTLAFGFIMWLIWGITA